MLLADWFLFSLLSTNLLRNAMQKLVNYKKIGKGIGKKNRKEFLSTALEYPENLNISENFKETVCLKYCFGCGYLVSFNNCVTPEG